jgi:glycosyltransferase involved in cell wall biosynthesis
MKVLFFSRDYTPHDYRFLKAIAEIGHECYYLRLEDRGQRLERRKLPDSVHVINWKWGKSPRDPVNDPYVITDLKTIWNEIRPDVIHTGPLPDVSWLAARAGLHPHAAMSWGFDLMHDIEISDAMRQTTAFALQNADWFLGDCYVERDTAASLGLNPAHTTIFPWGIDLQKLTRKKSLLRGEFVQDDDFVLISLRTMEPNYNVATIVKGFLLAAQNVSSLKLLLLGDGSQKAMLQQMASSAPEEIQKRIFWIGRKKNDELKDYYCASDLYLSASITDGTSVSLLEAMAFEVPVLVSAIPGNLEWVTADETGLLFEPNNEQMLAEKILFCYENRGKLNSMTKNALKMIEEKADWEKNKFQLTTAYEQAIAVSKQRGFSR